MAMFMQQDTFPPFIVLFSVETCPWKCVDPLCQTHCLRHDGRKCKCGHSQLERYADSKRCPVRSDDANFARRRWSSECPL